MIPIQHTIILNVEGIDALKEVSDLYLLDSSGTCLIRQKFRASEVEASDEDLFTSYFMALQQFFDEVDMNQAKSNIKLVDRGNFKLLIEQDEETEVFAILVASQDDYELRSKLKSLLDQFARDYQDEIVNFSGNISKFSNFRTIIQSKFPSELISRDHVPVIANNTLFYRLTDPVNINQKISLDSQFSMRWTEEYHQIVKMIDGRKSIAEISQSISDIPKIIDLISLLMGLNVIKVVLYPEIFEDDVFLITNDSISKIFSEGTIERKIIENSYGQRGFQLILLNDGLRSLSEIARLTQVPLDEIIKHVKEFVASGYLVKKSESQVKKRQKLDLEALKESSLAFYSGLLKNQQYSSLNFEILLDTMESAGIDAALLISSSEERLEKVNLSKLNTFYGAIIRVLSYFHDHVYMSNVSEDGSTGEIVVNKCFECQFAEKIRAKKICKFTTGLIKGVIKYIEMDTEKMIYNKVRVEQKNCSANENPNCSWEIKLNF